MWTAKETTNEDKDKIKELLNDFDSLYRQDALPAQEEIVDSLEAQFEDKGFLSEKQITLLDNIIGQIAAFQEMGEDDYFAPHENVFSNK